MQNIHNYVLAVVVKAHTNVVSKPTTKPHCDYLVVVCNLFARAASATVQLEQFSRGDTILFMVRPWARSSILILASGPLTADLGDLVTDWPVFCSPRPLALRVRSSFQFTNPRK